MPNGHINCHKMEHKIIIWTNLGTWELPSKATVCTGDHSANPENGANQLSFLLSVYLVVATELLSLFSRSVSALNLPVTVEDWVCLQRITEVERDISLQTYHQWALGKVLIQNQQEKEKAMKSWNSSFNIYNISLGSFYSNILGATELLLCQPTGSNTGQFQELLYQ